MLNKVQTLENLLNKNKRILLEKREIVSQLEKQLNDYIDRIDTDIQEYEESIHSYEILKEQESKKWKKKSDEIEQAIHYKYIDIIHRKSNEAQLVESMIKEQYDHLIKEEKELKVSISRLDESVHNQEEKKIDLERDITRLTKINENQRISSPYSSQFSNTQDNSYNQNQYHSKSHELFTTNTNPFLNGFTTASDIITRRKKTFSSSISPSPSHPKDFH
ncbi:hypothetical protein WA158_006450 [Blastocystis sp. Blastoise]